MTRKCCVTHHASLNDPVLGVVAHVDRYRLRVHQRFAFSTAIHPTAIHANGPIIRQIPSTSVSTSTSRCAITTAATKPLTIHALQHIIKTRKHSASHDPVISIDSIVLFPFCWIPLPLFSHLFLRQLRCSFSNSYVMRFTYRARAVHSLKPHVTTRLAEIHGDFGFVVHCYIHLFCSPNPAVG